MKWWYSIYNLALHLWFLKWESKKGYTTEEIREIIKSLANRKGFVIKLPNISCPRFCNANPKKQGLSAELGLLGFSWMTALETHTPGKGYACVGEGEKAKWSCALDSAWFQPKPSQRKTLERQKKREERKRSLTPNVHKPTQKMYLPPTLINLSACKAAPAHRHLQN